MFSNLSYWPRTYLLVGFLAFLISTVLMPAAIFILRRCGLVDHTADNKFHKQPVPRGGGVILFLAFAAAVLFPGYRSHQMNGVLIGGFICLLLGAFDDFVRRIPGSWKLLVLFAVTLILSRYGVRLNVFKYYPLDIAFTLLWIVGVISAFNGLDNMDGLASGVAVIVCTIFLIIAMQAFLISGTETSLSWFGMLAVGLIGANLGFLLFNFKPARIFMGDSGSLFMGFMLASLGVMGEWTENRIISCTIPVLVLGVPLFDFAYIIIARIIRGETRSLRAVIEHCAPDHLSHRLVWIGFSERQAVLFIYILSIALGITGVLLRNSSSSIDNILGVVQGIAVVIVVIVLMGAAAHAHRMLTASDKKRK